MIVNAWCHIGHFEGESTINPVPFVVEDKNEHDPLALHEGVQQCNKEDEGYNTNDSADWQ